MVRGNAARRKELAAMRRQDRKDEVARKKGGASRATPIEARARILAFCAEAQRRGRQDGSSGGQNARAWVVAKDGGKDICEAWWRHGECGSKRCRLSHETTLAHLTGMPDGSAAEGGAAIGAVRGSKKRGGRRQRDNAALPPMLCVPLSDVHAGGKLRYDAKVRTQRREKSDLLFVEVSGALVFDKFNPSVFAQWAASSTALLTECQDASSLAVAKVGCEAEVETKG